MLVPNARPVQDKRLDFQANLSSNLFSSYFKNARGGMRSMKKKKKVER